MCVIACIDTYINQNWVKQRLRFSQDERISHNCKYEPSDRHLAEQTETMEYWNINIKGGVNQLVLIYQRCCYML